MPTEKEENSELKKEELEDNLINGEDRNELFDRIVGTSDYQEAEKQFRDNPEKEKIFTVEEELNKWREYSYKFGIGENIKPQIQKEYEELINNKEKEIEDKEELFDRWDEKSEDQLIKPLENKQEITQSLNKEMKETEEVKTELPNNTEQEELLKETKSTEILNPKESQEAIEEAFQDIEANIKEQPESVQKIYEEIKDKFKNYAIIDGREFMFTDISGSGEKIIALVKDENKWKTRLFRISNSDNQWKSYPGKDGDRIMKGEEDNRLHHYVQSAKLDKDIYKIISSFKKDNNFNNYLSKYIPEKQSNRLIDELEFKEEYLELKNPEWKWYQEFCQKFFMNYMYFSNESRHVSLDKGCYKSVKDISLTKSETQEYYKKIAEAFEELNQNPIAKAEIEDWYNKYPEKRKNISEFLNGSNVPDYFKEFAQKYYDGVSGLFEYGFSRNPPQSLIPDFTKEKIVDSYKKGDISIEEYEVKSPEGDDLIFAMAYDDKGRVYIDNIYDPRVGMNDYGIKEKICQMGHLVYKSEDYKEQTFGIPYEYKKEADSGYTNINAFWAKNPIIKKFKEELVERGELSKA